MSINPKRIERLWEACPELCPLYLRIDPKLGYETDEGEPVCKSHAHALIRDKIVWWLAKKPEGWEALVVRVGAGFTNLSHDAQDGRTKSTFLGQSTDPLEACILAAERVLGLPEWKEKECDPFGLGPAKPV